MCCTRVSIACSTVLQLPTANFKRHSQRRPVVLDPAADGMPRGPGGEREDTSDFTCSREWTRLSGVFFGRAGRVKAVFGALLSCVSIFRA